MDSMKKFVLAFAVASLAFACKSSDSTQVSDPATAAGPACATSCDMAAKKECSDAMKAECSSAKTECSAEAKKECSGAAKPECSSAKVCPMTGQTYN